jgi:hypothetical protein
VFGLRDGGIFIKFNNCHKRFVMLIESLHCPTFITVQRIIFTPKPVQALTVLLHAL